MTRLESITDTAGMDFIDSASLKKFKGRISPLCNVLAVEGKRTRFKGVITTSMGDAVKFSYVIDTPSRKVVVGDCCYCIRDKDWDRFVKKTKGMTEMAPYGFRVHTGCDGMARAEFTHKEESDNGGSIQNGKRA